MKIEDLELKLKQELLETVKQREMRQELEGKQKDAETSSTKLEKEISRLNEDNMDLYQKLKQAVGLSNELKEIVENERDLFDQDLRKMQDEAQQQLNHHERRQSFIRNKLYALAHALKIEILYTVRETEDILQQIVDDVTESCKQQEEIKQNII